MFCTSSTLSYHTRANIHSIYFSFINKIALVKITSLSVISAFSNQTIGELLTSMKVSRKIAYFKVLTNSRPSLRRIFGISFQAMLSTMTCTVPVFIEETLFICHKNQYPHREHGGNQQLFAIPFPNIMRPLPDLQLSKTAWIPPTDSSHRMVSPIILIPCPCSRSAQ